MARRTGFDLRDGVNVMASVGQHFWVRFGPEVLPVWCHILLAKVGHRHAAWQVFESVRLDQVMKAVNGYRFFVRAGSLQR